MKYIAVLDFEATCDDRANKNTSFNFNQLEIIEIPLALVSLEDRAVVASFNSFVQPVKQPVLTPFCTKLTSITQAQIDEAETIDIVSVKLDAWLRNHGVNAKNMLVATCGDWDLKTMWPKQVHASGGMLATPEYFKRWCNIKKVFREATGVKSKGMLHMLAHYGIDHVGHHHRGVDDVKNLCNLVLTMVDAGVVFEPTGQVVQ